MIPENFAVIIMPGRALSLQVKEISISEINGKVRLNVYTPAGAGSIEMSRADAAMLTSDLLKLKPA